MTESDNILEFIDGSLSPEAEQRLFDDMARQPELRTMLRQFIMIGEGVRSDREAFAPPAGLEYALMSGLGLAPLAEIAPAVTAGGWMAKMGVAGMAKVWTVVAAFVTGAILAAGGTYLVTKSGDSSSVQAVSSPAAAAPATSSAPASPTLPPQSAQAAPGGQSGAPLMAASMQHDTIVRVVVRERSPQVYPNSMSSGANTSSPTAKNSVPEDTAPNQSQQPSVEPVSLMAGPKVAEGMSKDTALLQRVPSSRVPVESVMSHLMQTEESPKSWFLEGRLQGVIGQSIAVDARQGSSFSNFAGGAYYRFDDHIMIGLEGGREPYAQSLGVNSGDTLRIEQMPTYWWGGASLRFNIYEFENTGILGNVGVYTQVTMGASTVGPVAHGRVGFNFARAGFPVTFTIAGEASSLAYNFRGQSLISARYGLTAGAQVGIW